MIISNLMTRLVSSTAVMLALTTTVAAAEEDSGSLLLEEVIVTAQKRSENLQDVAVSVTAFSGDAMAALGFDSSMDITSQTPNMSFGNQLGEGNNPSIAIRGITLNDFSDANEGPVGIYVDDVYLASLAGQTFQMFDLERVEVLRGPQGTLYGRNTTGGLAHFISRKPTDYTDGYVKLTAAEHGQTDIEGAIGGAISDWLAVRASLSYKHDNGYFENSLTGKNGNQTNGFGYRFLADFTLSESVGILLNIHGTDIDQRQPYYKHVGTGIGPNGGACSLEQANSGQCTDFFGYSESDDDPHSGAFNTQEDLEISTLGFSGTLTWDGEDMQLISITAYEETDKSYVEEADMGPGDLLTNFYLTDARQYTQEIRLSGDGAQHNWVVGGYYFNDRRDNTTAFDVLRDLRPLFTDPLTNPTGFSPDNFVMLYRNDYIQTTESYAIFGQAQYDFGERFTFTLGGRYTWEDKTFDFDAAFVEPDFYSDPLFTVPLIDSVQDISSSNFSGKVGLDYKLNDDIMFFANVSRGFKSGGFNASLAFVEQEITPFRPEKLTAYEIGMKSTLADGRVRFNAGAFYYDYKDMQIFNFINSGGVPLSILTNGSDAEIIGGELELAASVTDNFEILLGAGFLETKTRDFSLFAGLDGDGAELYDDLSGNKLVQSPNVSLNGLARYNHQLGDIGRLTWQVDFNYLSEQFFSINNSPNLKGEAYSVWNARVTLASIDEKWELALWAKNIFDKDYDLYAFDLSYNFGFDQHFKGRPRWLGASLTYRMN